MIFDLPIGRVVGLALGWRMTFLCIAAITGLAILYLWRCFPKIASGDTSFSPKDLPALFHSSMARGVFLLSLAFATAYFTLGIDSGTFLGGVTAASGYLSLIGLVAAVIAAISAIYCVAVYLPALKRSGRKEA